MAAPVMWAQEAQFSPGPRSVSEARGFVGGLLLQHGLSYLVDDVQLVVSELVTNALVHARTQIKVTLEESLVGVKLTVHDDASTPPVARVAAVTDTGGRGLEIVDKCCLKWGFEVESDGGKSVWALFALASSREQPGGGIAHF